MKALIILVALTVSTISFAAKPYGMAGCGFGSQIMGKDGNQVLAATTNGTGIQTFGISSGTSNCVTASEQTAMIKNFIEANTESLITDMSKGQGETLKTLSSFYGCNSDEFASEMKNNYSNLAPNMTNSTKTMVNINKVIEDSKTLNANCTHAI